MKRVMPLTILALLVVIVWLSIGLARVEDQRYALWMDLCHSPYHMTLWHAAELKTLEAQNRIYQESKTCLRTRHARTHWVWDLWYALTD